MLTVNVVPKDGAVRTDNTQIWHTRMLCKFTGAETSGQSLNLIV